MLKLPSIFFLLGLYSLALYGWGRTTERLVRIGWPWPMTICLGLATVVTAGGILVSLELAYAPALDLLVGIGLATAAVFVWHDSRSTPLVAATPRGPFLAAIGPGALLTIAAMAFTAVYLVPPQVFNPYDDFETYLSLPQRLLATGTLKPGNFNNFGINGLGAQSFLQGFIAAHWPIGTVNGVDAWFGPGLCAAVVLAAGWRAGLAGWLLALCVASIFFISPQTVNVSTLYIGSALFMFVALMPSGRNDDGSPVDLASPAAAMVLGLTYATAVALKSTFALPALVHFAVLLSGFMLASGTRRALSARWALITVLTGLACLLPWLANQLYRVPAGFVRQLAATGTGEGPVSATRVAFDPFSTEPLFYAFGASQAQYTAMVAMGGVSAGIIFFRARRGGRARTPGSSWVLASCLCLPLFFSLHMATVGRYALGYDTALRYAVPLVIALFPVCVVCAASDFPQAARPISLRQSLRSARILALGGITAALLASFAGPLTRRIEQAVESGSELSFTQFATEQFLRRYNRSAIDGKIAASVREIQASVPPGETILAFINPSFQLDFRRNRILEVQPGGLGSPLQRFPFKAAPVDAAGFLTANGVEWVFWQYEGLTARSIKSMQQAARSSYTAERRTATNTIRFIRTLEQLKSRGEVIHDDGTFTLFRVR